MNPRCASWQGNFFFSFDFVIIHLVRARNINFISYSVFIFNSMTFSQNQSEIDGARSGRHPDSGDGPSVMNVDNPSAVVNEFHTSESRVGSSSRATSPLSTKHPVDNKVVKNPSSHSKRRTSGVSDLAKRTKSTIGSEDPAGVDNASAPGAETIRSFPIYREESLPSNLPEIGSLATGQFVVLESRWLNGSGIERIAKVGNDSAPTDIIFFIRQRSLDQIEFIRNSLEKHCDVGVIVGQPDGWCSGFPYE